MISAEKEYEFVSSQIQIHNQRIMDAFKLFVQIYSAIIGGSVWLSTNEHIDKMKLPTFVRLSDVLVILVTMLIIIMVLENLRGWHGYRWAQARLGGTDEKGDYRIPPPTLFRSSRMEAIMMIVMSIAALLFCYYNPFAIGLNSN